MQNLNPLLLTDSYKQSHHHLYPSGMEYVYSNTTARKSRIDGVEHIVVFGTQYLAMEYLQDIWNEHFFNVPIEEVLSEYHRIIDHHLGPNVIDDDKIRYLHQLGYLPLHLKALPEGTKCPIGVPFLTIVNTDPQCYWLTNFIETIIQTMLWKPITSATIAERYYLLLKNYAEETSDNPAFVQWQGHDFSMRGMPSLDSASISGLAHLLFFTGSDTIPAILMAEEYYGADITKELISASVTASEHSIQCSHYDGEDEEAYIRQMLSACPEGIVSIVADGYDYFKFITHELPKFKDEILSRNGKVVVRPDTGDPVKIVCGYNIDPEQSRLSAEAIVSEEERMRYNFVTFRNYDCVKSSDGYYVTSDRKIISEEEAVGSIEILDRIFGSKVNSKGYKELDPHIGLIYGDSITFERATQICEGLKRKGYASTNVVFGIGSYTYAYNTRDTFGIAMKATWVQVNGVPKNIFKDPKTGDGMKKSARGLLSVQNVNNEITLQQDCTPRQENTGMLQTVFLNGAIINPATLSEVRKRCAI